MEIRILVPDAASGTSLAERLATTFGPDHVSLREQSREVDVLIDREPEPAIVRVVDAVARWFEQARVASVELRLGQRSYKLAQWVRVDK